MPKTLVPKTQSTRRSKQPRGSTTATGLTARVKGDSRKTVRPEKPGITKPRRNPSPGKRKPRKHKAGSPTKPPAKRDDEPMSRTSRPIKSSKEPAIVKNLTIKDAVEDFLDNLDVPEVQATDEKPLTTLGEFLVSLDAQIRVGDTDILDRGKGALSWLQGKVLSQVYPLDRKRFKAAAKRGQWGEFLKKYWKYSPSTAYWCRRIYETWHDSRMEVKRLGFTGCIQELLAMYDVDDEGNVVKPGARGSDPSDGGDKNPPGPTNEDPGKKPLTTIGTLLKQLSSTTDKLVATATAMPESFFAPEKEIQLIKDFITSVDGVILNMRRAQDRLRELKMKSAEQVLQDAKVDEEVESNMGDINGATIPRG